MGIMGKIFRRNRGDPGNPGFDRGPGGRYHAAYAKGRLPTPGAMDMAYETLGLAQFAPSGPTVRTRTPIMPLPKAAQLFVQHAVRTDGVPTTANGIKGQPLFDPTIGYVKGPGVNDSTGRFLNIAVPAPYQAGVNNPTPDRAKGAP